MQNNAGTDDAQGMEGEDSADDTASSHGASEAAKLDAGTRALLDEAIVQLGFEGKDAAKRPTSAGGQCGRKLQSAPSSPKTPPWTPPDTVALTPPDHAEDAGVAPIADGESPRSAAFELHSTCRDGVTRTVERLARPNMFFVVQCCVGCLLVGIYFI